MRLLLISNSTNPGEEYLQYPIENIKQFLGSVKSVVFIPYAGVTISFDNYLSKVAARFAQIGVAVTSVHQCSEPIRAVMEAEAIVVGGGNTFQLIKMLHQTGLLPAIRERAIAGVPYIGWSAGSNVACPTICTTNDMPIVEPPSFAAANLIPFQINPHYTDAHPAGHGGETRQQRIEEYLAANPASTVVGLREGTILLHDSGKLSLIGNRPMRIFRFGEAAYEVNSGDDLSFLL